MTDQTRTGVVAGGAECDHRGDHRAYLGNMGPIAMYRCGACGAVVLSGDGEGGA